MTADKITKTAVINALASLDADTDSVIVSVRLTPTDIAYIEHSAWEDHINRSEWVRRLIWESRKRHAHEEG